MSDMVIDNNYFHFGLHPDPDIGGGYGGITYFSTTKRNNILIHHNVFENAPLYCIHNLSGDNVKIYNNTAVAGMTSAIPSYWRSAAPVFINTTNTVARAGWEVFNNVFDCEPDRSGIFWNIGTSPTPGAQVDANVMHNAQGGVNSPFWNQSPNTLPTILDPLFMGSGTKPSPFFMPSAQSPLVDSALFIPGITDGFNGFGPEIGALEIPLSGWQIISGNGSFETPGYEATFSTGNVAGWESAGSLANAVRVMNTRSADHGSWYASIHQGGWSSRSIAQTTSHIAAAGEQVHLKFSTCISSTWGARLGMRLYYLNNGQRVTFFEWTDTYNWWTNRVGSDVNGQPWEQIQFAPVDVPTAAVGKPIGVWFTNIVPAGEVLIDKVELAITSPGGLNVSTNSSFEIPGYEATFSTGAVAGWDNAGSLANAVRVMNVRSAAHGSWYASIHQGGWSSRSIAQTTSHIAAAGQQANLNVSTSISSTWGARLGVRLYYLNNGQRVTFFEWTDTYNWWTNRVGSDVNGQPWQHLEFDPVDVPAAAVGKPVGVWFTNTVAAGEVLIDNVSMILE
jgi:hypothetical protein